MKAVIIEDEKLIAKELQNKIATVAPDVEIVEILSSVKSAEKWLASNPHPELIFADIQLSDGISFEIFENNTINCPIIFVTAYDEYAIRAFRVNGIDYLLKPVDVNELKKAIDKCRTTKTENGQAPVSMQELMTMLQATPPKKLYKEKFVVKFRNNWIPVYTQDISCIIRDNLNYLYTLSGEKHILDFVTLEEVEDLLDPEDFFRANRQCIVHMNAIQSIKPLDNQKLILTLKVPANMQQDVSREKSPGFKKWFER